MYIIINDIKFATLSLYQKEFHRMKSENKNMKIFIEYPSMIWYYGKWDGKYRIYNNLIITERKSSKTRFNHHHYINTTLRTSRLLLNGSEQYARTDEHFLPLAIWRKHWKTTAEVEYYRHKYSFFCIMTWEEYSTKCYKIVNISIFK